MLSAAAEAAPEVLLAVPHAAGVKVKVVLAKLTPAGKLSGSCTVVIGATLPPGFVTVRLKTLVPPEAIVNGAKDFVTVGGA